MESSTYAIDPIAAQFHNDWDSWFKPLTGAVGTGKTWACIWELVFHACRSVPPSQRVHTGERRAKYAIVRRTAPRLETTTLASLEKIFKKNLSTSGQYPIYADVRVPDPFNAGDHIDIQFILIAISDATDEQENAKLRSLEITGAYINELDEYPSHDIVSKVFDRCRRFPDAIKKVGPSGVLENVVDADGKPVGYQGQGLVVADYNKPEEAHWLCKWHRNVEGERPTGVAFYDYPAPLLEVKDADGVVIDHTPNPEAASYISKQPSGITYWLEKVVTSRHDRSYIERMIMNRYGSTASGKGVFTNYDFTRHRLKEVAAINPNRPVVIGFDHSGMNPAMSIMQAMDKGIVLLEELVAHDITPDDFLHSVFLLWLSRQNLQRHTIEIVCDPADPRRMGAAGDLTMVKNLHKLGFSRAHPAPATWGRDPKRMIRGVDESFSRGILFHNPGLRWTGEALGGKYCYRAIRSSYGNFSQTPDKNAHSHIADAIMLGVNMIRLGSAGIQRNQDAQSQPLYQSIHV